MATTTIEFAIRFHDPDSGKIIPINSFKDEGKAMLRDYFTREDVWAQVVAPIGYLKLPTVTFRPRSLLIRAICEHSEPSHIFDALLEWADQQADVMYEFGGVECKIEIITVNVDVDPENVAGGSRRRRGRSSARKTRRRKTRR